MRRLILIHWRLLLAKVLKWLKGLTCWLGRGAGLKSLIEILRLFLGVLLKAFGKEDF